VIGPQIGLRWFKKQGRWTFNTEGRFFAGVNCQYITQQVDMGPHLNPGPNSDGTYTPFVPKRCAHHGHARRLRHEFSRRSKCGWKAVSDNRAISLHAGWTGMWMDGIAAQTP